MTLKDCLLSSVFALSIVLTGCSKPDDPAAVHRALGNEYARKAEWAAAATEYGLSLQANPRDRKVWELKANAHLRLGQLSQAAESLAKPAEYTSDPSAKAESYRLVAGMYVEQREFEEAEKAFAQALITGNQAARSWYMAACQLPWLPERALGRRGGQAFRDTLVRTGLDPASADRYAARARDPAVLRGPLNWYRAMPFSLREPAGPIRVPTMFAWGNRDRFVSRAAAELCGRYVTGPYRFTELDGASHWLPEQAADQVAALLAEHFAATL